MAAKTGGVHVPTCDLPKAGETCSGRAGNHVQRKLPLSGPEYTQPEQEKSIWNKTAGICKRREC